MSVRGPEHFVSGKDVDHVATSISALTDHHRKLAKGLFY